MKEAALYSGMVKGGLADGWALYRIADGSPGLKPFDIGGCAPDTRAVAVEAKVARRPWNPQKDAVPWDLFPSHQRAWLKVYARMGALALAIIYREAEKDMLVCSMAVPRDFAETTPAMAGTRPIWLQREEGLWRGWNNLLTPRK